MQEGDGVSNVEIKDDSIKVFERLARKNGIRYAVKKEKATDPPTYYIFFKGKSAEVIEATLKEFTKAKLERSGRHSEYDGKTYYPKYAEDLVHSEVLTPENTPEEYKDPKVLWNSVEMFEKKDDAQLTRTWKIELPNLWTYAFAIMFVRELCERKSLTD